jgi:hypothetical protein
LKGCNLSLYKLNNDRQYFQVFAGYHSPLWATFSRNDTPPFSTELPSRQSLELLLKNSFNPNDAKDKTGLIVASHLLELRLGLTKCKGSGLVFVGLAMENLCQHIADCLGQGGMQDQREALLQELGICQAVLKGYGKSYPPELLETLHRALVRLRGALHAIRHSDDIVPEPLSESLWDQPWPQVPPQADMPRRRRRHDTDTDEGEGEDPDSDERDWEKRPKKIAVPGSEDYDGWRQ